MPRTALSPEAIARARELDTDNDFISAFFGSKQTALIVGFISAASVVAGVIYRKRLVK